MLSLQFITEKTQTKYEVKILTAVHKKQQQQKNLLKMYQRNMTKARFCFN